MYIITGGVFTDTSFTSVVVGTIESYGPFDSYEQALNVWRGKMGRMIDTCTHRLFISSVDAAPPAVTPWLPIASCPLNEEVLLGYYGDDATWFGYYWKGHLFQWKQMGAPLATGGATRNAPTHWMQVTAPV